VLLKKNLKLKLKSQKYNNVKKYIGKYIVYILLKSLFKIGN